MSKRLLALRMLAWSFYDFGPSVKGSSTGAGERGEMATAPRECAACGGEGVRRDRWGREQPCESCRGRGSVRVDPYTEKAEAAVWAGSGLRSRRVLCDACGGSGRWGAHGDTCSRCGGSGGFSVPFEVLEDPLRGDPSLRLEEALESRSRAGSYSELGRALDGLLVASPARWRGFWEWMAVEPSEGLWDVAGPSWAEVFLLGRMPGRIRVPADVRYAWEHRHVHARQAEQARERSRSRVHRRLTARDRQIRELYADGRGLPSDVIAERFGISASQVRRIVR